MSIINSNSADTIDSNYTRSPLDYDDSCLDIGSENIYSFKRVSDPRKESVLSCDWTLSGEWVQKAENKLNLFQKLPDNWDGYGGRRLDAHVYLNVLGFLSEMSPWILPEPDIFPGSSGGVQFEWSHNRRELEIEFSQSGKISILKVESDNSMEELTIDVNNLGVINDFLIWLKGQ